MNEERKQQLLSLADEYFITLNGIPVDVLDCGDKIGLIEIHDSAMDYELMDWDEYERQTLRNNGQLKK